MPIAEGRGEPGILCDEARTGPPQAFVPDRHEVLELGAPPLVAVHAGLLHQAPLLLEAMQGAESLPRRTRPLHKARLYGSRYAHRRLQHLPAALGGEATLARDSQLLGELPLDAPRALLELLLSGLERGTLHLGGSELLAHLAQHLLQLPLPQPQALHRELGAPALLAQRRSLGFHCRRGRAQLLVEALGLVAAVGDDLAEGVDAVLSLGAQSS
mmetsp:Transcript_102303/g.295949  ORF Transcript_102303/g.295949 Transcript_102303/m.295949 type:complete len:214 (-) Transcript_102303:1377-2018(-)